jgi:hypothetical protein
MQRRPEELEDFKSRINLSEYAAACGYRLDRKASSRNSAVMVRSPGDKIIIALGADRHWIYFSVGEDRDSGSIVDFVQIGRAAPWETCERNCALGWRAAHQGCHGPGQRHSCPRSNQPQRT